MTGQLGTSGELILDQHVVVSQSRDTPPKNASPRKRGARRMIMIAALSLGGTFALFVTISLIIGYSIASSPWSGPQSDHFDGRRFHNTEPTALPSFGRGLKLITTWNGTEWAEWRDIEPGQTPPRRRGDGELRATFVNHSTVLLQLDGVNLLTDPIWSERASPISFIGPRRHHSPGLTYQQLPPIDIVLISHDHYDHLDADTLRRIAQDHDPLIVAGLGNGPLLRELGFTRVQELDWDDVIEHGQVRIIGQRSRHFSGRGVGDRNNTLWLSYVIDAPGGRIYFGGDTASGSHFAESGERFGPFRLALLPIGAYRPRWFMGEVHVDPEESVQAHRELRSNLSLAIHHGTFQLTAEGRDDPQEELRAALANQGVDDSAFIVLRPGEGRDIPPPDESNEHRQASR